MSNYIAFNSTKTIPSESVERQFEFSDRWFFAGGNPQSPTEFFGGDGTGASCTGGGDSVTITFPGNEYPGGAYFGALWDDFDGTTRRQTNFDFIVVCMTARINVTETYRDADVYRLSCTATPQGGTPDYTYRWSSDIPGSRAIGAQDQATLEVEIPINSVGTIAVSVTDSGTPPCPPAAAGFEVCGHVTCDFSTTLISPPPAGETGPYVYECRSSSQSAFGPLEHEWSPDPAWVSEEGTVARFSFPDDDEHSIHLSVEDTTGCRAFKTRKVGGYEFIVSTDPGGEDAGTIRGTRGAMEFEVKAEATGNFIGPPPLQMTFEFSRPAINSEGTAVGNLVSLLPPSYEFSWSVRQPKGRWQIKVLGYRSNTVSFKIDKRAQIVEVARSWIGASSAEIGGNCNDLTSKVYNHVGLPLSGFTDAQYRAASTACAGDGCLLFYSRPNADPGDVAHVAIKSGGERININSNTTPLEPVINEAINDGVLSGAPNPYDSQIEERSTVNLDEN